jgi:hypothetical protein
VTNTSERRAINHLGTIAPFVAFFATLLLITLPRGLNSVVSVVNLPVLARSAQAAKAFGGSDAGSLLKAAIKLRKDGHIFADVFPVYDLWPPGMIGVDRVMLGVESATGIPIVLQMVLLNCAVWAGFLGFCFFLIRRWKGLAIALVFAAGVLLYSGVTQWGTQAGLFYSDSFGAVLFCTSLLLLLIMVRATAMRRRLWLAASAGVALAGAAYFRASFELVDDATVIVAAVVLVILLLIRWRGRSAGARALPLFVSLLMMGAVAEFVMLPWRLYAGLRIHRGDFRWTTLSDLASAARWEPTAFVLKQGNGFAVAGHSNWACIDDPVECRKIFSLEETSKHPYMGAAGGHFTSAQFDQLTLQSVLAHPFSYIFERIDALSFGFSSNTGGAIKELALPESLLMLGLFIAMVVVAVRRRRFLDPAYLFFLFATVVQLGTIALIHMEPRYFLGIELSTIVMAPFVLAPERSVPPDTPPPAPVL